ncbi:bacterio-opsin activator domain-containing protein [Natrarchaeobius oligotrophus]|uniref:PAS domain S-box protein n=1 Tax=Natrarchaeobius chitinivorans TaxID=1679083 RepID=A0A3N6PP14_NATCH|nr:bacterio-opsin activator domain-containing protein [Natrarchaeobius chitinivorans]RQH03480.1 PAS domain S-box protein [Natrarchaeobius chitinivorans]
MAGSPSDGNGPDGGCTNAGENGPLADVTFDVRNLVGLLPEYAVAVLDSDGRVAAWNESANRLTGYDESEIVGEHYRTFFPKHVRASDRPERLLERARADGRAEDEGWRVRRDGRRLWVVEVIVPIRNEDVQDDSDGSDGEIRGYGWFVHDRTEQRERRRELRAEKAFAESVFEAQPDIVYAFDANGNFLEWNDRVAEVTGYSDGKLAEMNPLEFIAPDHRGRFAASVQRLLGDDEFVTAEADLLTAEGDRIPYEFNSARIVDPNGDVLGFTGVGRDVSDRKARERELERLERLNAVVRTIDETMVTAETRAEVETAVVDAFVASDAYRFAVIGRTDASVADGRTETATAVDRSIWTPRAWAGIDSSALDELASFVDPPDDGPDPPPIETGAVRRYRSLHDSPVDRWRTDARERGYGSVAVVPIAASDRTFGVLLIAAVESAAFADREREVLREFGGTVGHAINAMEVRRLLYTDTVVELEFESTDRSDVCIDLSSRANCRLTVDNVLSLTDEEFVYYVTASGCDPERVDELAREHEAIREFRSIEVVDDESHLELVVSGPTIPGLLADHGARLHSHVVDRGDSEIVVQLSPGGEVRGLVDAITETYPETALRSKRSVDRPVETSGDFRRSVEKRLTTKQRQALAAAYYAGYFEWPTRNTDAGDLADRLGIARQTFHQHLRVAQAKLFTAFFDAEPNSSVSPPDGG